MAEPDRKPGPDPATRNLRRVYRDIARLIVLHEAVNAPCTLLDGDIEVPLPQNVRGQIAIRIATATAKVKSQVAALENGE